MLLAFKEKLKEVSGGFALVVLIAISSNFLSNQYNAPVILFALLIGIAFNFLNNEKNCKAELNLLLALYSEWELPF